MPTVAVLADPPVEGVLPGLEDVLPDGDDATLYAAMLADVGEAVQNGAGELLVNYRPHDSVDTRARMESVLTEELPRPEDVRYEVQVGESFSARAGNTATHLLETEDVDSVVIAEPTATFLSREVIGTVTMKLRTRDAVVGPASRGRVALAGLRQPVDFANTFAPPALETVVNRAREADLDVDFTELLPVVETPTDLATAITTVRARVRAGRNVPPRVGEFIADRDLRVIADDDGSLSVVAGPDPGP